MPGTETNHRDIFTIASAVKKAVEKHGRSQFSLTHLHEDFGAPEPMVTGKCLSDEANLLRFGVCLDELGWRDPPPLYRDGILYVPEWSSLVRVLWQECLSARYRAERIAVQCREQISAAEQSASNLLTAWSTQAAEEAIKPKV